MPEFKILWAHEAKDWIKRNKELDAEEGFSAKEIEERSRELYHVPSDEEKKAIETELSSISDFLMSFTKEMIKLWEEKKNEAFMQIWLESNPIFAIEFWYESSAESALFRIWNAENDRETGRIIFEDTATISYDSEILY
jgi:hypothetical protein